MAGLSGSRPAMRKLIGERVVVCEFREHDRYKRSIGLCQAGGEDLGAAMVSTGMCLGVHAVQRGRPLALGAACMRTTAKRHGTGGRNAASLRIGRGEPGGLRRHEQRVIDLVTAILAIGILRGCGQHLSQPGGFSAVLGKRPEQHRSRRTRPYRLTESRIGRGRTLRRVLATRMGD
jgi:hypothetical protein